MKWYAGSDHAGFRLKTTLVKALRDQGDEVVDVGTDNGETSVDYPDFGAAVARGVASDPGTRGLCVCGSGIGISIGANKVAGARAACVTDSFSAQLARAHNDANIVCVGERITGPGLALEIVRVFRDGVFEGGRHQRRVDKLAALERRSD
jgi:ribose 5-phosphate isomerase B